MNECEQCALLRFEIGQFRHRIQILEEAVNVLKLMPMYWLNGIKPDVSEEARYIINQKPEDPIELLPAADPGEVKP
jgi:hypothetical protein